MNVNKTRIHNYTITLVFGQQLMMKLKTNAIIVRFMVYIQVQCIYKQTFRAPNSSPLMGLYPLLYTVNLHFLDFI